MPVLTIVKDGETRRLDFPAGRRLRETLDAARIPVRWGCLGNGACGLCVVQVEEGELDPPHDNELLNLTPGQLEQGFRLACQLRPTGDLRIRIPHGGSSWGELSAEELAGAAAPTGETAPAGSGLGLAVDLGTTHIRLSLWDLARGERLSGHAGPNPQAVYGSDVVTRLVAARDSAEDAREIARLPAEAIGAALREMCGRAGVEPRQVTRVEIVGNTAMLALLTETDPEALLDPSSWTRPVPCRLDATKTWVTATGIDPGAKVELVAPFAGFVGSDLLAAVLATGLTQGASGLLIDFGTNSEIALWSGGVLRVTSAAGGPAFEGYGLRCAMPAEEGAIRRISRNGDRPHLRFEVIGGGRARGVCGSGLVDLIACLLADGELSPSGRLTAEHGPGGYVVQGEAPPIGLTNGDVDTFQRAKAAIGVGVATLLADAGTEAAALERVCVCGAFGRHLDAANARLIGLLPDVPLERIELSGNAAMAGCERLLLSPESGAELDAVRDEALIVNLARTDDFADLFLENLYLRRMEARR